MILISQIKTELLEEADNKKIFLIFTFTAYKTKVWPFLYLGKIIMCR